VCGAANRACKGKHESGDGVTITEAVSMKGPLVQIPIRPGLTIQMTEEQARREGLLPEVKEREQAPNKARRRPATKAKRTDE
jgi:hypothetical protein